MSVIISQRVLEYLLVYHGLKVIRSIKILEMVFAILVFTIYRFKKSSQLFQIFCKYLHNSATKHLICRAQDLNFFQLKNIGGFRELLAMSHCQKREQKTYFQPGDYSMMSKFLALYSKLYLEIKLHHLNRYKTCVCTSYFINNSS